MLDMLIYYESHNKIENRKEEKSMEKKIDFNSYFENDLFSERDIDLICEKIDKNIPGLLVNDKYFDIDDKLIKLNTRFSIMFK